MWFNIKLAWRNLFRNRRRTVIAAVAIGIGLASLIFFDAFMIGSGQSLIRSSTDSFLGHAQIHSREYRRERDIDKTILRAPEILAELGRDRNVSAYAPRVYSLAMISSPANFQSVQLVGIDPEREKRVSQVASTLEAGDFFANGGDRTILLGGKLAEDLEVSLGDRVVVTVAKARGGGVAQELFRVGGIYRFGVREMDAGMAFVRRSRLQAAAGLGAEAIHEIALRFRNLQAASERRNPFWQTYSRYGNEAVSWEALLPQVNSFIQSIGTLRAAMGFMLLVVVIFGIVNTLFMSFYERMFEFAVLRAVGTRPAGIRQLMLYEAGALGIVSMAFGVILGLLSVWIFSRGGVDYRGLEFAGATIREVIHPVLEPYQFIVYPLTLFLFTLLVGIYPAIAAGKMKIAEALRKSL